MNHTIQFTTSISVYKEVKNVDKWFLGLNFSTIFKNFPIVILQGSPDLRVMQLLIGYTKSFVLLSNVEYSEEWDTEFS